MITLSVYDCFIRTEKFTEVITSKESSVRFSFLLFLLRYIVKIQLHLQYLIANTIKTILEKGRSKKTSVHCSLQR